MAPLKIKKIGQTSYEITGFTTSELDELMSMEYRDARDKIIPMLDDRNDGQGTYWAHCVGIYRVQFMPGRVVIKTNL